MLLAKSAAAVTAVAAGMQPAVVDTTASKQKLSSKGGPYRPPFFCY
jgi:hypothetical protein